jgi:hypothetical protein
MGAVFAHVNHVAHEGSAAHSVVCHAQLFSKHAEHAELMFPSDRLPLMSSSEPSISAVVEQLISEAKRLRATIPKWLN